MWKERGIERRSESKLRGEEEEEGDDDDDDGDDNNDRRRNRPSNEVKMSREKYDDDGQVSPDDDMREWLASKNVRGRGSIGFQAQR